MGFPKRGESGIRSRQRTVEGDMKILLPLLCFLFLWAQGVIAQERISPDQTVARKIESGKTDLLSAALNDGDYVNVSIGYKGKINFFVINPDGTLGRRVRVVGASGEGKCRFR